MALTGVDTDWELSAITIPKTGLSLQSVAVAVRSLLPGWRHEVSGEFVQSGNGISLQLRHNGRVIFSETAKDADPDAADTLLRKDLQGGAFKVVKETQPYVAASALYGDGRSDEQVTAAEKEADQIIASLPATDENVIWAINLKGVIADVRGEYPEAESLLKKLPRFAGARLNLGNVYDHQHKPAMAITEYQAAIWLDPKLASPHANLFNVYDDQHRLEIAIVECQAAIQLDPKLALPHAHLCKVYDEQHKLEIAMLECQTAIQLDPKDATYHNNLGKVYQDQHKPEMAIAKFQKAIQLDPKSALPHSNLGIVYYDQHKLEMAIAEARAAIQRDPKLAAPHYVLGIALRDTAVSSGTDAEREKRLEDACRAFLEGSKLAPHDSNFPARMHDIDSLMNGHGHCPPT